MEVDFVFLELLNAVYNNKLGFRMICLVEACLSVVGGVDSTYNAV